MYAEETANSLGPLAFIFFVGEYIEKMWSSQEKSDIKGTPIV